MRKSTIQSDTKTFPANYLLLLRNFLEYKNFNTEEIFQNVKLPAHLTNDPEQFVSHALLKQYIETVIEKTNTPELGLYFGQFLNFTAHGDLGNAVISSKNLNESLQMISKYFKTRTPLIDINIETQNEVCMMSASFNLLPDAVEHFLVDAYFATLISVRKFILNDKHYDVSIYLKRPKPKNTEPYTELFGEKVFFSAKNNEYHLPTESLALTFPLSNPIAREIAERKCQQKLKELEHLDDLVSKVKTLLIATPCYFQNLDELAQQLHMSTRTLRRKLSDLDTSYQTILDELRKELAINYLQNSSLSIVEIAHMLQFSDSSNFSSAFRKWTNKPPSDFRN